MGVLGGLFLVFLILLVFMFAGFYVTANEVSNKVRGLKGATPKPRRGKGEGLDNQEKLNVILNHLAEAGFFVVSEQEQVFVDNALSHAIGECSSVEGFFWGVNAQGIRVKPNNAGGLYDYWLIYSRNKIGFNWQGPA